MEEVEGDCGRAESGREEREAEEFAHVEPQVYSSQDVGERRSGGLKSVGPLPSAGAAIGRNPLISLPAND